ncbi:MAG: hypothetical protein LBB75_09830 [Oscillospiraceae bacterium]|jgi:hypothetical protein|nr:hypothetical protein [Oscillospiraceae bacterium]
MKQLTTILALLLAAALLFAACGPKGQPANTDEDGTSDVTTTVPDTTIEVITTEEPAAGESETSAEPTTTQAESSSTATTTAAAPALPQGKADILAAYTKVVNKVKTDMPEYVSNDWQTMSNVDINGALYWTVSQVAGGYLETKEQSTPSKQTKGSHAKWFAMPTDTHKVGCVLTDTSKVESASCVKSGDDYVITITLLPEKDPTRDMANPYNTKGWTGKLFDVIDIIEVLEVGKNIPGVNADNLYSTFKGTAVLKYDPATDKIITLDHVIDVRIFMGTKSAKVIADYHFYDFKW